MTYEQALKELLETQEKLFAVLVKTLEKATEQQEAAKQILESSVKIKEFITELDEYGVTMRKRESKARNI